MNVLFTVYFIHLFISILSSFYLFRLGLAPQIHDLYGKVKFTGETYTCLKIFDIFELLKYYWLLSASLSVHVVFPQRRRSIT